MIDDSTASENNESEVDDLLQKKEFGISLRLAREKSNMSVADVAQKLLISVDIIKALENSQADALPALTFTQGYIRSYARLVNVSADEIIDDYIKMAPDAKQMLLPNSVLPVQKCSNDRLVKLITYSFVIIAVFVFVFWFSKTDFKLKSEGVDDIVKFNSRGSDKVAPEAVLEESVQPASEIKPADIEQVPDTENSVASVTNDTHKAVLESELVTNVTEPSIATSASIKSAPLENSDNSPAAVADVLLLSAQADSWCEIQDATGKRLYYQLLNRGEEVELLGTAPFMVFLGNAPKIRVEVNNKIVDFDNLINKNSNIASLEISKDATVTSQSSQ